MERYFAKAYILHLEHICYNWSNYSDPALAVAVLRRVPASSRAEGKQDKDKLEAAVSSANDTDAECWA